MSLPETTVITRKQVAELLGIEECMDAVEQAFKMQALGKAAPPKILGLHVSGGGFHIKAGAMELNRNYFVAKTNANFPGNPTSNGLPTIQGVVSVFDATDGRLLCLMDSIELTIVRTGAATGVASKYLSRKDSKTATIVGCGNQGIISLKALLAVRNLTKVFAYDIDSGRSRKFAEDLASSRVEIVPIDEVSTAVMESDICVTCTTSRKPVLRRSDIRPGTFIAAVGADSDDKQELESSILTSAKVVVDLVDQCSTIGELHHALEAGLMKPSDVHAQLGEIIAGTKPGREDDNEIIVFDSTGMALQDVAAGAIVYEKAVVKKIGTSITLGN